MRTGQIAVLTSRGVVGVGGPDAGRFLDSVFTSDASKAGAGRAVYGGLLSPQGKILFDFIVFAEPGGFLIDIRRDLLADFVSRLGFYRLRARVEIAELSAARAVVAAWGGEAPPDLDGPVAPDPRLPSLGYRAVVSSGTANPLGYAGATEADYHAHRIGLAVPEGGVDFAFGEAYPHDADMDQLGGVDFGKGCYIGQEVVSRMEHRGSARRRIVAVRGGQLPPAGTVIAAGERPVGSMGSSADGRGLALVRLDRAREAAEAGVPLMAAGAPVELSIPAWAGFGWPAAERSDQ
jgi:folate-binding protein YgfZ